MDIEDLFNENFIEEEKNEVLVIPEFDPCNGEGKPSEKQNGATKCCSTDQNKSLTCSQLQPTIVQQQEELKIEQPKGEVRTKFLCFKCKTNLPNFTMKQDKVCKTCFLEMTVHRFKSSLRGNLKIWKDDLNLICISGGSNSMALLHMLHQSLFGNVQHRKMFFKVHILYIEESSAVFGISQEQRQKNIDFIVSICKEYQFTYTIIPIERIYDISTDIDLKAVDGDATQKIEEEKKQDELQHSVPINLQEVENKIIEVEAIEEKRNQLVKLIETLSSISNFREDLILYLKKWIIADFALKYNFKKILFGTSGHKVATLLLGQLAKGRGSSIAHEISYIDDKNFGGRITFMNPMREFLHKEISLYNYLNKVDITQQKSLAQINNALSGQPAFGSADLMIEKFFDRLQDKFNVNTVPTVVKLTNKLLKNDYKGEYPFCPLCFGIREEVNNLLEMGSTIKKIELKEDGTNEVIAIKSCDEWLSSELEKAFCFGCKRMVISAVKKEDFTSLLPEVIKVNCKRTLEAKY